MKVDMTYLEKLSKLEVDDKEKFLKEFANIASCFEKFEEIEKLDDGLPTSKTVKISELREDIVIKSDIDPLLNAPKKDKGCYVAPLVVEQ